MCFPDPEEKVAYIPFGCEHRLKSDDPAARASAIVKATTHYDNPEILLEVSRGLQPGMKGLEMNEIPAEDRLAVRGW